MLLLNLFLTISFQKSFKESDTQPAVPPISVSIDMMTKTGKFGTSTPKACPAKELAKEPCGKTAWFNPASQGDQPPTFSYRFKGEKFQVYGKYDKDHGKMRIYLDDEVVAEVNQYTDGEDVIYALQYESEILAYDWHTIKVTPMNDDIELYKFAYWPSVHAKRLNSTEIQKPWNVEGDGIGGLREWAHENNKAGVKKIKTFQFSKIWVYGSTAITHGNMFLSINGEEHFVNQNTTTRHDNLLVFESDQLPLENYTVTISQIFEDCVFQCIYYIEDPLPTPAPISVSIDMMTKTGKYGISTPVACPAKELPKEPCGKTAWFNPASQGDKPPTFSYRFKGEKYQVYGKLDKDHGKIQISLDDKVVTEINQYTDGEDVLYALHYTSDIIPYGWHTIKVTPMNDDIEIYKFTYWPNVNALRINSTEIRPLWNKESDGVGGLREWAHENNKAGIKKKITIRTSKIWIYGSTAISHGDMMFTINGKEIPINENTTTRIDNYLLYESDYMPLDDYTLTFSQHIEDCVLHSIFYLPVPQPTPIPISVPVYQFNKSGKYGINDKNLCPKKELVPYPCGPTLWYNPASQGDNVPSFNYTFKGVKFQVYGKYDDSHGTFKLYLDGALIKEISQVGTKDAYHQLQYTSEVLKYGEHTVKIEPNNAELEIYKLTYWPTLYAVRVNSTEMLPLWNPESDDIGGLREWAHENNHPGEKKSITVHCSKIWVYGSTAIGHGNLMLTIDGKEIEVNENTTIRHDGVLVYESEYMPLENHTFTFSQHFEDCLLNGFYYDPMPSPEPEPQDYVLEDSNCNKDNNKRCEKKVTNIKENIQVYVEVTNFKNYKQKGNGGAIYIENAALKVNKSEFTLCESDEGAGGAIYVHNTFEITNTYLIENIKFKQCSAQYGGAVYLYASSTKIDAIIKNCIFRENSAKAQKGAPDNKYGGSAIYLSVYKGNVDLCQFVNNKGYGGIWKVVDNFHNQKSLRLLDESSESVHVSNCLFDLEKNGDCALFFVRGENGPEFILSNCKFTGKLAKNSYYIDGRVISKNSKELLVKSCSFDSDLKKAFNLDVKNKFVSVDMKSQVFKKDDGIVTWKMIYTIVLPVVGVIAVVALVVAIIVSKKLNRKTPLETEIPTEMKDSLL